MDFLLAGLELYMEVDIVRGSFLFCLVVCCVGGFFCHFVIVGVVAQEVKR